MYFLNKLKQLHEKVNNLSIFEILYRGNPLGFVLTRNTWKRQNVQCIKRTYKTTQFVSGNRWKTIRTLLPISHNFDYFYFTQPHGMNVSHEFQCVRLKMTSMFRRPAKDNSISMQLKWLRHLQQKLKTSETKTQRKFTCSAHIKAASVSGTLYMNYYLGHFQ